MVVEQKYVVGYSHILSIYIVPTAKRNKNYGVFHKYNNCFRNTLRWIRP